MNMKKLKIIVSWVLLSNMFQLNQIHQFNKTSLKLKQFYNTVSEAIEEFVLEISYKCRAERITLNKICSTTKKNFRSQSCLLPIHFKKYTYKTCKKSIKIPSILSE